MPVFKFLDKIQHRNEMCARDWTPRIGSEKIVFMLYLLLALLLRS
jgi:hypothetical protein